MDKGQSLLEVTIAIGIAVIILSTMTVITLTGLKNSQFAQNQTTATKLAQDGLEQARAMRDQNKDGSVCISASNYSWTQMWTYDCAANNCNFVIQLSGVCSNPTTTPDNLKATPYLKLMGATPQLLDNKFYRKIVIENYGAANSHQKKVTSQVSWNDTGGSHQVNLSTILADPNTQTPIY